MATCDECGHNAWNVEYPCKRGKDCPFYVDDRESEFGCFTGDCPHETVQECFDALKVEYLRVTSETSECAHCGEVCRREPCPCDR